MIVDIALDPSGKQLYQVHESSKFVRREMPRSTKFNNHEIDDNDKTPIHKILGTISPSTLNQNKYYDEPPEIPGPVVKQEDEFYGDQELSNLDLNNDSAKHNDIWSEDVEQAFEEVLLIIPKNGLNKIKISGRSCGRNELISDYILTKTGKFRTRKQVSSHIQVIKNLGKNAKLIKLINEGPLFNSLAEQEENTKNFEEIFLQINLNKSLGFGSKASTKRRFSDVDMGPIRKSKPMPLDLTRQSLNISIENFFMSVYDSMLNNPIILTLQDNNQEIPTVKLKPNANISNRFPDLVNLHGLNQPILHNLVKLHLPTLPLNYSIDQGLKTNMLLKANTVEPKNYSMFTIIYNYGKEFFKINENHIVLNDNYNFLNKFWKYFLSTEMTSGLDSLNHLTIKQIFYENDASESPKSDSNTSNVLKIPKLKIRHVLLWEFVKVDDLKDAITTTSRLLLPQQTYPLESPVVPQIINYANSFYDPSTSAAGGTSTTITSGPVSTTTAGTGSGSGATDSFYPMMDPNYSHQPKKLYHNIPPINASTPPINTALAAQTTPNTAVTSASSIAPPSAHAVPELSMNMNSMTLPMMAELDQHSLMQSQLPPVSHQPPVPHQVQGPPGTVPVPGPVPGPSNTVPGPFLQPVQFTNYPQHIEYDYQFLYDYNANEN